MNNYLSYAEADELCDGMIRQYIGKDAPIPAFIDRAMLSQQEANEFVERELCCPYCGYMVGIAFSDCTGHLKLKCKKCKRISVLNFAYFCRRRFRRK